MKTSICILVHLVLLGSLALAACSSEEADTAWERWSYKKAQRDIVIKSWTDRVSASRRCSDFKNIFEELGGQYESAEDSTFGTGMAKVWELVKESECDAPV